MWFMRANTRHAMVTTHTYNSRRVGLVTISKRLMICDEGWKANKQKNTKYIKYTKYTKYTKRSNSLTTRKVAMLVLIKLLDARKPSTCLYFYCFHASWHFCLWCHLAVLDCLIFVKSSRYLVECPPGAWQCLSHCEKIDSCCLFVCTLVLFCLLSNIREF